ncbi:hypothetical protein KKB64_01270 [Patescibacteria group bacterium]|nr:hypothetical protein [Patescibacteria group bacterium]MBU1472405.1 hypothetical protein [Patescibacteria group bacterium]MBU2460053.1 hypothetical protein [Patescibacteria group bacterium]MBU2544783.1 hypothetical protein [Patescibacteria group bacterium]
MKIERFTNDANNLVTILADGGKTLTLEIPPFYGPAKSLLANTGKAKAPGTTTRLYTKAAEILQEEADKWGTPVEYELETGFTSMKNWAVQIGSAIFSWDTVHPAVDKPETIIAHATIYPE